MGQPASEHPAVHADSLGPALEPALCEAVRERGGTLSHVRWFRSDWQRGGGATAFATFTGADGRGRAAVAKLPVGPSELRWTVALGTDASAEPEWCTPRVLASGDSLGGYDLGWLVMERLSGESMSHHADADGVHAMLRACAMFQSRALRVRPPSDAPTPSPDFDALVDKSREVIRRSDIAETTAWSVELRHAHKAMPMLLSRWRSREINAWCHGDCHVGNAMLRVPTGAASGGAAAVANGHPQVCLLPTAPIVLIDLALVHTGHWVEDAVYLERTMWGRPGALDGVHVVKELAAARRALGLACDGDYGMIANVKRALHAAIAPALLELEGNPRYLSAALEVLRRTLPQVAH
ncbi:MAG: aminoglycoside phosphotransferase family protein [Phycisphaerales bacterium]